MKFDPSEVVMTSVKGEKTVLGGSGGNVITPSVGAVARPGKFHTSGKNIYDRNGQMFIPRGMNIGGTIANNGSGWPDFALNDSYARGQLTWGCNTVRIVMYITSRMGWSQKAKELAAGKTNAQADAAVDALADQLTKFWRDRGFVVMMEAHDLTQSPLQVDDSTMTTTGRRWVSEIVHFWRRYARRWRHDDMVWFNIANEPNLGPDNWKVLNEEACKAIRVDAGASNIIVMDLLYYASDLGHDFNKKPIPFGYEDHMVPHFIGKYGNIIASNHNYGSHGTYITDAAVRNHYTHYLSRDIPIMTGEIGAPNKSGVSNIGNAEWEHTAAKYTCQVGLDLNVGVMWWASNFNDAYRLYETPNSNAVINEFAPDATFTLSRSGQVYKDYLDAVKLKNPWTP